GRAGRGVLAPAPGCRPGRRWAGGRRSRPRRHRRGRRGSQPPVCDRRALASGRRAGRGRRLAVRGAGIVRSMSRLWHPFADMAAVKSGEFVVARGEGARVWDEQGHRYIDAKGGLWYCAVGHGRGEIADAAAAQMRELAGYDIFGSTANRPAIELAERVSTLAPFADGAVFFASGGSDAVDTAGKLALRYW